MRGRGAGALAGSVRPRASVAAQVSGMVSHGCGGEERDGVAVEPRHAATATASDADFTFKSKLAEESHCWFASARGYLAVWFAEPIICCREGEATEGLSLVEPGVAGATASSFSPHPASKSAPHNAPKT